MLPALAALLPTAGQAIGSVGLGALGGYLGSGGGGFGQQQPQKLSKYTPQQMNAQNQVLSQALSGLQGNMGSFEPFAQRARTQFNQQTIPGIAERFTSLGAGAQRSSAFQQQLGQAGAGLEEALAALGSQHGLQQNQQLMQLLGIGLQPQFEYANPQQGLGSQALAGATPKILELIAKYFLGMQ